MDQFGRRSFLNPNIGLPTDRIDPVLTGDITVYAQGQNVKVAKPYTSNLYGYDTGSSYAAPQVAGLAAYLLSVPGGGTFDAMGMKQKIFSLSRKFDAADATLLAYNGVRELACPSNTRKSRREEMRLSAREKARVKVNGQIKGREIGPQTVFANGQFLSNEFANLVGSPSYSAQSFFFSR